MYRPSPVMNNYAVHLLGVILGSVIQFGRRELALSFYVSFRYDRLRRRL